MKDLPYFSSIPEPRLKYAICPALDSELCAPNLHQGIGMEWFLCTEYATSFLLWTECVSPPPNTYVETLIPNVILFFWRWAFGGS